MRTVKADVSIIGAGVIGCALAYFLSKERMKVMVVERDSIASHASGFAPGILDPLALLPEVVDLMLPLTWQSFQMHRVLAQELKEATGIDYHFCQSPCLKLAFTEAEAKEMKLKIDSQRKQGFRVSWLDNGSVHTMENRISPEVIGAAYNEDAGELESYRYVLALAQAAEKYGAEIHYGECLGLRRKGTNAFTVQLSSGEIACDHVILAMGPWTGLASSWLNFPIPIKPQKGQTLRIQASGPPFAHTLTWSTHYNTSTRPDGLIYTGATHEDVGFDENPTNEGRDNLISGLLTMVPSLAKAELVLQTACLRPLSTDGLPIIGEIPGWPGVYVATGHWKKGMLLNPTTAQMITDLLVRGSASLPLKPFTPDRFTTRTS